LSSYRENEKICHHVFTGVCISAAIVVVVLATIFIYAYLKWRKENLKTYPSAGRKKGGKGGITKI
jgi:F0F1-type ATP synthase membrane subunit a